MLRRFSLCWLVYWVSLASVGCGDNLLPAPACGDGVVAPDEACDDGNPTDGDGCDVNCTVSACGNGIRSTTEACDDGNTTDGDGCDADCTLTACGNGIRGTGEACDDGNTIDGDGCDANCTVTACGNGIRTALEACDDGNVIDGDGCDANCTVTACGNGIPSAPEGCDDGNAIDSDNCRVTCEPATCGDGVPATLATGTLHEQCDDGNAIDTDDCRTTCELPICGDGVAATLATGTLHEQCDDGNAIDTDDCRTTCEIPVCGDGVAATMATGSRHEDCDGASPGGTAPVETATCDLDCTTRTCGDGTVNQTAGEQCDDANTSNADGCTNACRSALCGDGFVRAGVEQCDDGNLVTEVCTYGAAACTVCDASCALMPGATSSCGDGVTQPLFESCDDGNATNGDWCNTGCVAPTLPPPVYVKASNSAAGDLFSVVALSADGSTLAVGAYNESSAATGIGGNQADDAAMWAGAVYIYVRSGATWVQQAYIKPSNTGATDRFGLSVALSADGSTLAVGAPYEDSAATGIDGNQADNSATDAGAVYMFTRSGATWSQAAYLKASNTDAFDHFGWSVALSTDGATLAVGAIFEASVATGVGGDEASNAAPVAGAVYVFARSGATWSQQAYVKASNTEGGDAFGHAVALADNGATLAVSATHEASAATGIDGDQSSNAASDAGAVYVFTRTGAAWAQQAYVKASNTGADDLFNVVALSSDGSTLVVGACGEASAGAPADNSRPSAGAVYVFARASGSWSQQAYLKAAMPVASGYFCGVAIAADGATLAIGASGEVDRRGAAYIFTRHGALWSQQRRLAVASDASDSFGWPNLSGDGLTLAVSAFGEDSDANGVGGDAGDNSAETAGAVYVFR